MSIKENFCRKIRDEISMTGAELARRSGITPATLNGFEKGRHGVSHEVLLRIANTLNVRPEQIIPKVIVAETLKKPKVSQKLTQEAVKITHQFFQGDNLEKKQMITIANEVYNLLILFENASEAEMSKSLQKDFYRGLAAKCLLDHIQKNKE